jgi:hypothetical protein
MAYTPRLWTNGANEMAYTPRLWTNGANEMAYTPRLWTNASFNRTHLGGGTLGYGCKVARC